MSLAKDLAAARTEEDVKDAYIKALGLKSVRKARKEGQPIPGFLAVIDREKAALMPTEKALGSGFPAGLG